VTFKEGTATLCGPVPVAPLGAGSVVGAASCTKTLGVGDHEVTAVVSGNYAGTDTQVVTVPKPVKTTIAADGELRIDASAGTYAADGGSTLLFDVDGRFKNAKNAAKNLAGSVQVEFEAGGKTYRIKSTSIDSLGAVEVTPGKLVCVGDFRDDCVEVGDLRATATLLDVTKKKAVTVDDDLTLRVSGVDGHTWQPDTLAITLWKGDTLLFSSRWNGAATEEQRLQRGHFDVDRK
jgi:hypothetical protein